MPDVAVIGGGVVGCSVAYHLAQAGARVAVVEQSRVGSGASEGAAGMLAPRAEGLEPGPLRDLARRGLELFPAAAAALREETGWDIELDTSGILRVAQSEAGAEELRRRTDGRWLDEGEVRGRVPGIGPVLGGLLVPDAQVSAPRLTATLAEAAARRGVAFHEGVRVTGLMEIGGRARGLLTTGGPVSADAVVVCAGAWSGVLDLGFPCPVRPVKGQLLRLRTRPQVLPLTVFGEHFYLVPKALGRVVAGATMEEVGFDRRPTVGAVAELTTRAAALLPALRDAALEEAWAGLRPGTPDGLPLIGPVPGREGLYVATGHFRNGILLSLVTGRLIAALMAGAPPDIDLDEFSPRRFQPEPGLLE